MGIYYKPMGATTAKRFGGVIPSIAPPTGEIRVRFFYRDVITGDEKIVTKFYNKGDNAIPPVDVGNVRETIDLFGNLKNPELIFQGWNYNQEQLNNLTNNIDVKAIYMTEDGWTYFILNVTSNTTGNIPLYFNKSDNSVLVVDRGDGSALRTVTTSGNVNFPYTYSQLNKRYVVKVKITSGTGTFYFGNNTAATTVVGGASILARHSLISCFIGESVINIGNYAFTNCYGLTDITIPKGVTNIGNNAFIDCSSLENITIPNTITNIGNYAFQRNYNLVNISIPNTITAIGISTFFDCYGLKDIVIPNSVTSIGISAFSSCFNLTNIVIPNSVKTINSFAFYNCFSLRLYSFISAVPPTLVAIDAFTGINAIAMFIVPMNSGSTYKTGTNWVVFANRVFENQTRWA